MISRRALLATLGAAVLIPGTAYAHGRTGLPRIVLLSWAPLGWDAGETAITEEELRAVGYTKGMTIAIDYRAADAREDRLPAMAREAVALKPGVIVPKEFRHDRSHAGLQLRVTLSVGRRR